MAIRPCQKPSNSGQNRSKRRRFPSKTDQNRAHFVMPILTFWGVTPSGASAKAVLPIPKGHFGVVQGSKMACGKVIHKIGKTGNRDSGCGIRQRTTARNRDSGFGHSPRAGPRSLVPGSSTLVPCPRPRLGLILYSPTWRGGYPPGAGKLRPAARGKGRAVPASPAGKSSHWLRAALYSPPHDRGASSGLPRRRRDEPG